eukprot:6176484-Pleurochrysis_carterae.AAC.4
MGIQTSCTKRSMSPVRQQRAYIAPSLVCFSNPFVMAAEHVLGPTLARAVRPAPQLQRYYE